MGNTPTPKSKRAFSNNININQYHIGWNILVYKKKPPTAKEKIRTDPRHNIVWLSANTFLSVC